MEINKKKEKIEINILLPEKEVSKKLKKTHMGQESVIPFRRLEKKERRDQQMQKIIL